MLFKKLSSSKSVMLSSFDFRSRNLDGLVRWWWRVTGVTESTAVSSFADFLMFDFKYVDRDFEYKPLFISAGRFEKTCLPVLMIALNLLAQQSLLDDWVML